MFDLEELAPERMRPLRRVEYERLLETGLLADEHVELLHGVLVEMSPQDSPHAGISAAIAHLLMRGLGDELQVRTHTPFPATESSMPEPDIQVVPAGFRVEWPDRAFLVIEVAASSLRKDRKIKTGIYASAGIPEYWIVDINHDAVEVHTHPVDGAYTRVERVGRGGTLRPVSFPGVELRVDDIL